LDLKAEQAFDPKKHMERVNGPQRTVLFRVRNGNEMSGRTKEWPSNPIWEPRPGTSTISNGPVHGAPVLRASIP